MVLIQIHKGGACNQNIASHFILEYSQSAPSMKELPFSRWLSMEHMGRSVGCNYQYRF
jgi:hypothetical protein